jgi:propionyl-CoA synthetase
MGASGQAAAAAGLSADAVEQRRSASASPTSSKYPGYYLTGDAGYRDADGYLWIMSRTDDVINVAGHRLSTGADGGGARLASRRRRVRGDRRARRAQGQVPLGLVVLKAGVERGRPSS